VFKLLYLLNQTRYFQDMWTEFSSVNFADLVNITATIPEMWNFS